MPPLRKRVICYTIRQVREHGYDQLKLHVFAAKEKSLKNLYEGTIDNRAGSSRAAERLGRWYKHLLSSGHRVILDTFMSYEAPFPGFTIQWQVYVPTDPGHEAGYCEAQFTDIGSRRYSDVQSFAIFSKRLGKKIESRKNRNDIVISNHTFNDPRLVIDALKAMRGKRVELATGDDFSDRAWIYAEGPHPWFLTDTLWRTFGYR